MPLAFEQWGRKTTQTNDIKVNLPITMSDKYYSCIAQIRGDLGQTGSYQVGNEAPEYFSIYNNYGYAGWSWIVIGK